MTSHSIEPVQAVLFDYGHTIVDFSFVEENLLECYEEVRRILTRQAYQELPEAQSFVRDVSRQVEASIADSYHREELEELDLINLFEDRLRVTGLMLPRELVRQIVAMEHRALLAGLSAPPENIAVLRDLRGHGLRVGLVSNATLLPEMMREDIERLGIAQYVDSAIFSSEAGVRKPHPAIFMQVLDALETAPNRAVFVGDRVRDDIGGAKSLGMRGVLTREFRQEELDSVSIRPDHVIDRLPDLVPYILRLIEGK